MEYFWRLTTRSFSEAWDLVFDRRVLSAVIAAAIFASTLFYRWRRRETIKERLKDAGVASLFTGAAFLIIFLLQLLVLTPKTLVEESEAAKSKAEAALTAATPASAPQAPPIKLDVTDIEGRKELEKTKDELLDTKRQLAEALAQLGNRVEDRTINDQQKEKLGGLLKDAPRGKVIVKADWTNGEAEQFAADIKNTLKGLGYDVFDVRNEVLSLNGKGGVYIYVKNPDAALPYAEAIQRAFIEIGITMPVREANKDMSTFTKTADQPMEQLDSDTIIIWVTRKP